ncbi:hypothetical protein IQ07DRAFT_645144 [Pyrenochaeta sp. DS3sAY3a]|nr:hypothetical protein IQ07DRAFT_645144 [Pyrenochaeta sp. DS3sAY3a]
MQNTYGLFFTPKFFITHAGVDVTPWHNQFKYKYASIRRKHESKDDNFPFRERAQPRRRSRSPARTPPPKRGNEQRRDDKCWLCGKIHKMADCPDFGKCLNCHMAGHTTAQCPQKSTHTATRIMRGMERLTIERPMNTTADAHGYKALCIAINEKAAVTEQLAVANRTMAELHAANTKLQHGIEKLQRDMEKLQCDMEKLQRDKDKLQRDKEEAIKQKTVLKQQRDVLREQTKRLKETRSRSNPELKQQPNVLAEQVKQEETSEEEELRPWRTQYFW